MKLSDLKDKKILILGFGREGKDTLKFLKKLFPKKVIGIADQKQFSISNLQFSNIKRYFGKNYLKAIKNYDVVIKSPGIPFKKIPTSDVGKITTQTEIFFNNCPGTIVGITGTKGKSTTTSLVYQILKQGGLKAHLIGNIGKPVLNLLLSAAPKDIYVYELSSHQLYNLKKSPHIAVFLNVFHEHLDYYRDFDEYARAKANITSHQTKNDFLVFNSQDKIVKKFAEKSKARKFPVKGEYYELDKNAARAVGKILKIKNETTKKAIRRFKPLPHRLELIGTFRGITFYNDALSTIPETAIFAIAALGSNVQTIMLGGYDRGIDFKKLAKRIMESKLKNLIFFPTTGQIIWSELRKMGGEKRFKAFFVDNMKDAVKIAYENTQKGKICLLSTASTSFSIFKDYKDKGDLFKKFVKFYRKSN
ncbi:MAG: Mur ligase family protein [Patescibacteria group bacterium]